MQLTVLLGLAAALGATAHPSGHAHNHRAFHDAHDKRAVSFYKAEHKPVSTTAPTTTTPPPAPAASSSGLGDAAAEANNLGASLFKPFCDGKISKRATEAEIAYAGNTGVSGQWGCNIMLIDDAAADKYTYTSVYTNHGSVGHQVTCFNKIGPKGLINGFFGFSAVTFSLAPGQSQTVAFDKNSQGACAFHPNSLPKTNFGEWAGTWVEFDFENQSNKGWSGADCSSLVAQNAGLDVPGCQVCHGDTCSTIYPGGKAQNAYVKGMEAADGVGLNIPPGKTSLNIKVGYSG